MNKVYTYTFPQEGRTSFRKVWLLLLVLPGVLLWYQGQVPFLLNKTQTVPIIDNPTAQIKETLKKLTPQQQKDIDLIARTIYGEARGEKSFRSLKAIAHVILNRVRSPNNWPATIEEVILQKDQFSCWNQTDPNFYKIQSVSFNNQRFLKCFEAALHAYFSKDDLTKGANHYHARRVKPWWIKKRKMVRVAQIDRHIFYKAV